MRRYLVINLTFNIAQKSNTLIDILSASLTPIIAILGSYIAYQQWKTNEKSRRQSLYDYRYEKIFKPVLDICNKTINSIKDGKIENIAELNELHNTKLTNIEKYSFLLKENDYIQLMIDYGAIREYVAFCHMHTKISKEDKSFMFVKLNRIYDIRRKYLSIEDEKYRTLWELVAIASKKLYQFVALDKLVENVRGCFISRKKKKVKDVN